jgi:hypothetical protein
MSILNRRNLRIALDQACGTTMAVLAKREGLSISRIGQICLAIGIEVRNELECVEAGPREIGLVIQRREFFWRQNYDRHGMYRDRLPAAESFHLELRRERMHDQEESYRKE